MQSMPKLVNDTPPGADHEQDSCMYCSYPVAQDCESSSLTRVAEIGAHTIYTCEQGGISFCLSTANRQAIAGDTVGHKEVIACADFKW